MKLLYNVVTVHPIQQEVHRVYDFRISSDMMPTSDHGLYLMCRLMTQGFGPLKRRLLRVTLLANGLPVSDVERIDGFFPLQIEVINSKTDVLTLLFNQNVFIPLGMLQCQSYTVRFVLNNSLGKDYAFYIFPLMYRASCAEMQAMHFLGNSSETQFKLTKAETRYDFVGGALPKSVPDYIWTFVESGAPTLPPNRHHSMPPPPPLPMQTQGERDRRALEETLAVLRKVSAAKLQPAPPRSLLSSSTINEPYSP
jgi:hypothetical protein